MKKTLSLLLALTLIFTALPTNMSFASSSGASSWAKTQIDFLINKGSIPKHLQNNYQKPITRLEFAQLLVPVLKLTQIEMGIAGEIGVTDYRSLAHVEGLTPIENLGANLNYTNSDKLIDTDDMDAYRLFAKQIIQGTGIVKTHTNGSRDMNYSPSNLITREQAAIMMVNTLEWNTQFTSSSDSENPFGKVFVASYKPLTFVDTKNVSSWAKPHVTLAVNNELISGVGNNRFDPSGNLTREQAMVMAHSIYNIFINDKDFYDRVTKANEGYVYRTSETASGGGFWTPKDRVINAVNNNTTSKMGATTPTPTNPSPENSQYFVGDVTTFIGKTLPEIEKVFGKHDTAAKDYYGNRCYYFDDTRFMVALDSTNKVIGVMYYATFPGYESDSSSLGYNIFNKITYGHSEEEIRKNYNVLSEGTSRRDFAQAYRMYPEFKGYMVELVYKNNSKIGRWLGSVVVYKGNFRTPLDIIAND